jgi:signal transduction histidine kinase
VKRNFTISLQNRLAISCTLFTGAAIGILTLAINLFTATTFNTLIKRNIIEKNREIVRSIGELYDPVNLSFDSIAVEAIGMYFVHEGYIVTVKDEWGGPVWDARSCDMEQCAQVINDISSRMERDFGLNGAIQNQQYPVQYNSRTVGTVNVETYGPFFYSETETQFLASINRLLLIAGLILALLSAGVSLLLSRSIARPILKAGEAARRIAHIHKMRTAHVWAAHVWAAHGAQPELGGESTEELRVRIHDHYRTRELRELSRSINELALELEEGERRQKQLSSDIAHELRTPLTCLQGSIEAMIDGVYQPGREHLESCHEEIIRLIHLVEDLHTLTGLEWETVKLHKTNFDLARLIQTTAEQFRAAASEKGIELRLNLVESPVNADYERLKQVFVNLLSNAVTYTERGSISIAVRKGSGGWDITVSDTGAGIAEDDVPHIFERFYRADKSRNRSTGGAGIGLAITAAIVAAHGGTISVESSSVENNSAKNGDGGHSNTGSTFRVHLASGPPQTSP